MLKYIIIGVLKNLFNDSSLWMAQWFGKQGAKLRKTSKVERTIGIKIIK